MDSHQRRLAHRAMRRSGLCSEGGSSPPSKEIVAVQETKPLQRGTKWLLTLLGSALTALLCAFFFAAVSVSGVQSIVAADVFLWIALAIFVVSLIAAAVMYCPAMTGGKSALLLALLVALAGAGFIGRSKTSSWLKQTKTEQDSKAPPTPMTEVQRIPPERTTFLPLPKLPAAICAESSKGRFRPECYEASGTNTQADVAFSAALKYAHDHNVSPTVLFGPYDYPKCAVWVEPSGIHPGVSLEGMGDGRSKITQSCFLPTTSMIISDATPPANQGYNSDGWCRDATNIEGRDGNVIDGVTTSGGRIKIKVRNRNFISNLQSSCDPNTSIFREFIESLAHNPARIEVFISAIQERDENQWKKLDADARKKKTADLIELVKSIRNAESSPATEIPLLVELNDMK